MATQTDKINKLDKEVAIIKKDIEVIKTNHLKHIHEDIDKIDSKFDKLTSWILYGVGTVAIGPTIKLLMSLSISIILYSVILNSYLFMLLLGLIALTIS